MNPYPQRTEFTGGTHIKAFTIFILIALTQSMCFVCSCSEEYTANYWLEKGDEFLRNSTFEIALDCYNKSIELDSTSASIWIKKGRALVGLNRYSEALY
ncbi:MAG TPA: hypothetical protein PKX20_04990, partial [Methanothrix soehngenii]|nr:hypothetical protein [Methanothrix soehngenii]